MPTLDWINCSQCQFPNIPEERFCRRCHAPLSIEDAQKPRAPITPATAPWFNNISTDGRPYTEETVTLYYDQNEPRILVLSSSGLEYATPDLVCYTQWTNITTIYHALWEYYLYFLADPILLPHGSIHAPTKVWGKPSATFAPRQIALRGFGYPDNTALCADFYRRARQLRRVLPTRAGGTKKF